MIGKALSGPAESANICARDNVVGAKQWAREPSRHGWKPMKKRARSIVSLYLVMCFVLSAWLQSQATVPTVKPEKESRQQDHMAEVKNEVLKRAVGEMSRVRVTLRDKTDVKGYISQIDAASFQVTDKKGQVRTIDYAQTVKIRKDGLSTAAKIALTAGVIGGLMITLGLIAYAARGD